MKRVISLMLAIAMVASLATGLAITVSAEDALVMFDFNSDSQNTTEGWEFDSTSKTLKFTKNGTYTEYGINKPNGEIETIDLNGCVISFQKSIAIGPNLTISDSKGNGKLLVIADFVNDPVDAMSVTFMVTNLIINNAEVEITTQAPSISVGSNGAITATDSKLTCISNGGQAIKFNGTTGDSARFNIYNSIVYSQGFEAGVLFDSPGTLNIANSSNITFIAENAKGFWAGDTMELNINNSEAVFSGLSEGIFVAKSGQISIDNSIVTVTASDADSDSVATGRTAIGSTDGNEINIKNNSEVYLEGYNLLSGIKGLTVSNSTLVGTATNFGIKANGDCTFVDSDVNIKSCNDGLVINGESNDLTIKYTAICDKSVEIYADSGKPEAVSKAIYIDDGDAILDNAHEELYGAYYDNGIFIENDGGAALEHLVFESGPAMPKLNGEKLTSAETYNAAHPGSDANAGTVTYNDTTKTITLNNVKRTSVENFLSLAGGDYNIVLVGDNTIYSDDTSKNCIKVSSGNMKISGDGTLDATTISAKNVIVKGGYVKANSIAGTIVPSATNYEVKKGSGVTTIGEYYTVTLNDNDATSCDPLDGYFVHDGATLPTPTKTGYEFKGWTSGTDTATKYTKINAGTKGDFEFDANWEIETYTISYNLNGGSISGGTNPTTYTNATESFTLINPTKTGSQFSGWSGTGIADKETTVTISKGLTGNRTYEANWIDLSGTVNSGAVKWAYDETNKILKFESSTKGTKVSIANFPTMPTPWQSFLTDAVIIDLSRDIAGIGQDAFAGFAGTIKYYGNNEEISDAVKSAAGGTNWVAYIDPKISGKSMQPGIYNNASTPENFGILSGSIELKQNGDLILNGVTISNTDVSPITYTGNLTIEFNGINNLSNSGTQGDKAMDVTGNVILSGTDTAELNFYAKDAVVFANDLHIAGGYVCIQAPEGKNALKTTGSLTYSAGYKTWVGTNTDALTQRDFEATDNVLVFDKTYTVTFKYDSGENEDIPVRRHIGLSSNGFPDGTNYTKNDRYNFVSWHTTDSGFDNSNKFLSIAKDTLNADKIAYAKLTPKVFSVNLVHNADLISRNVTSYTYGNSVTLPVASEMTKAKSTFRGWFTTNTDFEHSTPVTEILSTDVGDKTFYAWWESTGGDISQTLVWNVVNDELQIVGSGTIPNYDPASSAPWYTVRTAIKNIVIDKNVTSIGKNAFSDLSNLEKVTVTQGTGLTTIDSTAFKGSLTNAKFYIYDDNVKTLLTNASVADANIYQYGGTAGNGVTWKYVESGTDSTLTFSGNGVISNNAGFATTGIKNNTSTIVIGSDITDITSANCFAGFNTTGTVTVESRTHMATLKSKATELSDWDWEFKEGGKVYYELNLVLDSGSIAGGNGPDKFEKGKNFTLPTNVEKTNSTFCGWYRTSTDFGDETKKVTSISSDAKGEQTLYAYWKAKYTPSTEPGKDKKLTVEDITVCTATIEVSGTDIKYGDNLDTYMREYCTTSGTYALVLSANKTNSSDAGIVNAMTGTDYTNADFYDISLTVNSSPVTDTGSTIIEVVLGFDPVGKSHINVYHNHGGTVTQLTNVGGPTNPAQAGTYYISYSEKAIHIFANQFSTYAIGYTIGGNNPDDDDDAQLLVEPEEDPDIDILLAGQVKTLKLAYRVNTLAISDFEVKKTLDTTQERYVIDFTSKTNAITYLTNAKIESVIIQNASIKELQKNNMGLEIRFVKGTVIITDFGDIGNYALHITMKDGIAKYYHKNAMTGTVANEFTFGAIANGKSLQNADVKFIVPISGIKHVYYIIDENTIGEWKFNESEGLCTFPLYKAGTYVATK